MLAHKKRDQQLWAIQASSEPKFTPNPVQFPEGKFSTWAPSASNGNPINQENFQCQSTTCFGSFPKCPPPFQFQNEQFADQDQYSVGCQRVTNNFCRYCRKPGHLLEVCRTREALYGPFHRQNWNDPNAGQTQNWGNRNANRGPLGADPPFQCNQNHEDTINMSELSEFIQQQVAEALQNLKGSN